MIEFVIRPQSYYENVPVGDLSQEIMYYIQLSSTTDQGGYSSNLLNLFVLKLSKLSTN